MTIKLKHEHKKIEALELIKLHHHFALPHLQRYLQSKGLRQCKSIKKIVVDHSSLDEKDYKALHYILKLLSNVNEISFHSNHMDTKDIGYLFNSLSSKKLSTMKFIDNWIGDKIPSQFFSFLKKKRLTVLDMSQNWLSDTGVQFLLDALETNTELQELILSCNDFGLSGMKAVRYFVLKHPSLKVLDISYNNLSGLGVEEISTLITQSKSLTHLNIRSSKICDEGAHLIAQALKSNNNLRYVDLSDNEISETGHHQLLCETEDLGQLECLILKYNHISPPVLKNNRSDLQVIY